MERSRKRKRPMQGYGKMDQARSRWGGGERLLTCGAGLEFMERRKLGKGSLS